MRGGRMVKAVHRAMHVPITWVRNPLRLMPQFMANEMPMSDDECKLDQMMSNTACTV